MADSADVRAKKVGDQMVTDFNSSSTNKMDVSRQNVKSVTYTGGTVGADHAAVADYLMRSRVSGIH